MSIVLAAPLAFLLYIGPPQESATPPDPEQVAQMVRDLEEAWAGKETETQVKVLGRASEVVHPDVIVEVSKGLKKKDDQVRGAAIEALRWMKHPQALERLHKTWKSNKDLRKQADLSAPLLRAIGQHGDPSSVRLLADKPYETYDYRTVRARILALGNIRTKESVAALMNMLKATSPKRVDGFIEDFRLALMVLTGTDQGPSSKLWLKWWQQAKKEFEVAPEPPALPRPIQRRWSDYWGLDRSYGRATRREDRGSDDPERRRKKR